MSYKTDIDQQRETQALAEFAKYIWWKNTDDALKFPERLIAKVMTFGVYEDVCRLIELVGKERLLYVLQHAEAGEFDARSWAYWHYRLTNIKYGEVPPMPKRKFYGDFSAELDNLT
ncbi:hypothetical protein LJB81_03650 [Desulfovibrio sp. OttesenSCG-928-M14]|nr:hypothetical protein [Desulfovibrio sp. OttesenSCG-928-M14]